MPLDTTQQDNPIRDAASRVGDRISDAASAAKTAVSDLGRTAAQTADENRAAAAKGLQSAASTLHQKADSFGAGQTVAGLARSAADTLSSTADYVKEHDVSRMMVDLERLVKNNPGQSLLAAAAIGFLVGRAFSSSD